MYPRPLSAIIFVYLAADEIEYNPQSAENHWPVLDRDVEELVAVPKNAPSSRVASNIRGEGAFV